MVVSDLLDQIVTGKYQNIRNIIEKDENNLLCLGRVKDLF
jgi:hypothetical protein